jgi:hypothetical protein
VSQYVGAQPLAWIDDALTPEAQPGPPPGPTLLLDIDPA